MHVQTAETTFNQVVDVRTLRAYFKESYYQLVKLLREPGFGLPIVGFPVVFFLVFGLVNRDGLFHGYPIARYLVASYSGFGSMGAAFFAVGVGLSYERGHGWLELKRVSPMPTAAYLLSKTFASIVFGLVILTVLIGIGSLMTNLRITPFEALHLALVITGGVIAFSSMGVFIGLLCPPGASAGLANLIYLPLSLFAGMWMPLEVLPKWLQSFAHFLPSYYFSRLGLHALGYFDESEARGWLVLGAYALVFSIASAFVFRRQQEAR